MALDRRNGFSFAIDVHYYMAQTAAHADGVQSYQARQDGDITRSYRTSLSYSNQVDSVFDVSAGAELALSRLVSLRAGAFTDNSANPALGTTVDSANVLRLDRYGGTFGVGLTLGSFDTTAGLVVARGQGDFGATDPWITHGVVPVRSTETTAMFVLSGAVTVKEAQKAIREALPFDVPILPDLGDGTSTQPLAPRIPSPLPAEPKPPPPSLTLGMSATPALSPPSNLWVPPR
jgi:hypothetical protein